MAIYFVSGHLDVTKEEFEEHYAPLIKKAIENGDSFVVGDCRGVDAMSQIFIKNNNGKALVYHMFESPRNNCGFLTVGGFKSDEERDSAMTNNSNFDIAWVRKGREKSGTAKNIKRRHEGFNRGLQNKIK